MSVTGYQDHLATGIFQLRQLSRLGALQLAGPARAPATMRRVPPAKSSSGRSNAGGGTGNAWMHQQWQVEAPCVTLGRLPPVAVHPFWSRESSRRCLARATAGRRAPAPGNQSPAGTQSARHPANSAAGAGLRGNRPFSNRLPLTGYGSPATLSTAWTTHCSCSGSALCCAALRSLDTVRSPAPVDKQVSPPVRLGCAGAWREFSACHLPAARRLALSGSCTRGNLERRCAPVTPGCRRPGYVEAAGSSIAAVDAAPGLQWRLRLQRPSCPAPGAPPVWLTHQPTAQ